MEYNLNLAKLARDPIQCIYRVTLQWLPQTCCLSVVYRNTILHSTKNNALHNHMVLFPACVPVVLTSYLRRPTGNSHASPGANACAGLKVLRPCSSSYTLLPHSYSTSMPY